MSDQPAGRDDRNADRWLAEIWQATPPPEPGEAAWAGVLAHIQASVPPASTRGSASVPEPLQGPRPTSRFPVGLGLGVTALAATAALLMVVVFGGLWLRGHHSVPEAAVDPLPVATDGDVEIISMDAGDFFALVVGQPPHRGPIVLASVDDVTIDDTGHDVEVRVPEDLRFGSSSPPMLIMPIDSGPGKE